MISMQHIYNQLKVPSTPSSSWPFITVFAVIHKHGEAQQEFAYPRVTCMLYVGCLSLSADRPSVCVHILPGVGYIRKNCALDIRRQGQLVSVCRWANVVHRLASSKNIRMGWGGKEGVGVTRCHRVECNCSPLVYMLMLTCVSVRRPKLAPTHKHTLESFTQICWQRMAKVFRMSIVSKQQRIVARTYAHKMPHISSRSGRSQKRHWAMDTRWANMFQPLFVST